MRKGKFATLGKTVMTLLVVFAFALYPLAAVGQLQPVPGKPGAEKIKPVPSKKVPPKMLKKPFQPKPVGPKPKVPPKMIKKPLPPKPVGPKPKVPPKMIKKPLPPKPETKRQ